MKREKENLKEIIPFTYREVEIAYIREDFQKNISSILKEVLRGDEQ